LPDPGLPVTRKAGTRHHLRASEFRLWPPAS
jgi:hypothetical protein